MFEDQSVDQLFAVDIAPSSPNRLQMEASQKLTFLMTIVNGSSGLFATGPRIDPNTGKLSFTPARDLYGNATFQIVLVDSGGAEKRGHTRGNNVSISRLLTISVISTNDAPSFVLQERIITIIASSDVVVYSEAHVASDISAGPVDEASQSLSFRVLSSSWQPFWISKPMISPDGTLQLQALGNTSFGQSLMVSLKDSGGTANGGVDTSLEQNMTIYVITKPAAVTSVTLFQTIENQLDVTWAHIDTSAAKNTVGRSQEFNLELTKDCSAYTPASAEAASCSSFKVSKVVGIEDCQTNQCRAVFSGLDAATRYLVRIVAKNTAGAGLAGFAGSFVIQAPAAPNSINISQLPTRSATSSLLKIEWAR